MILTTEQISNIIKTNPNRSVIQRGVTYNKLMRAHMYGVKLQDCLTPIESFEKPELRSLRARYTKSNKDLFSRLSRPIDKVFSAKGGSVYYNLPDTQEKKARGLISDVRDGYSVRKWVEVYWKPHMLDDPFGIIFLEIPSSKEAQQLQQQGKSFIYPTYKAITEIYDYLPKGNMLDYIVFRMDVADKSLNGFKPEDIIYRVVDDAMDYLVKREGETVSILKEHSYVNLFGKVPAMLNSDIIDPSTNCSYLSLFDDAIELADQFLLKGSIKVMSDFRHGFPKYSEFADSCTDCKGTGYKGAEDCKECKGTGKKIMIRPSDVKLLSWPERDDVKILPSEVGGYISPDKTFYEIAVTDLRDLENAMNVTIWGTQAKLQTQGMSVGSDGQTKTATEVMDEIKPQADRLQLISEMAEKRDKFIRDNVIRLQVSMNYSGSSVNYGRRYMIEGPDAIWEKYSEARTAGSPINVLDDLLTEYYEAKYSSDPVALAIGLKLMYVEPFVHYKAAEVKTLSPDPVDYKAKLYFSEWLSVQSDALLLSTDVVVLRESLVTYCAVKQLPEPAKPVAA